MYKRQEEERVEKRRRVAEELDTSKLDVGINFDDDDEAEGFVAVPVEVQTDVKPVRPKRVHASRFTPGYDW